MASPIDRSYTPMQNPYTDPSMMESETDKSFSQSTLQQSALSRVHGNDVVIMQREREINDIAKGIIELADIFKDLQTMVIDQGTMLDRIDYNVERMTVDVKGAEKELVVVCYCLDPSYLTTLILTFIGHWVPEEVYQAQGNSSVGLDYRRSHHCLDHQAKALSYHCRQLTTRHTTCSRAARYRVLISTQHVLLARSLLTPCRPP